MIRYRFRLKRFYNLTLGTGASTGLGYQVVPRRSGTLAAPQDDALTFPGPFRRAAPKLIGRAARYVHQKIGLGGLAGLRRLGVPHSHLAVAPPRHDGSFLCQARSAAYADPLVAAPRFTFGCEWAGDQRCTSTGTITSLGMDHFGFANSQNTPCVSMREKRRGKLANHMILLYY